MQEAKTLAEQIINRGKEAFNNKCYLDALWKYANAYELCCINGLSNNIKGKVLLYCAEASLELLKESPPHKYYLLGSYSVSCSTKCINSALPEFQFEVSINLLGHASFIRPTLTIFLMLSHAGLLQKSPSLEIPTTNRQSAM